MNIAASVNPLSGFLLVLGDTHIRGILASCQGIALSQAHWSIMLIRAVYSTGPGGHHVQSSPFVRTCPCDFAQRYAAFISQWPD